MLGLPSLPGSCIGVPQCRYRLCARPGYFNRFVELGDCLVVSCFLLVSLPQVIVSPIGVADLKSLLALHYRLIRPAGHHVMPSQVSIHYRIERINFQYALTLCQRFLSSASRLQKMRELVMSFNEGRVERDGAFEFFLCPRPIPIEISSHDSLSIVSFGQRVIDRQSLFRC